MTAKDTPAPLRRPGGIDREAAVVVNKIVDNLRVLGYRRRAGNASAPGPSGAGRPGHTAPRETHRPVIDDTTEQGETAARPSEAPPVPRARTAPGRIGAAGLIRDVSYEIMPFEGTQRNVERHVPTDVALTVTVTERRGLDATIDLTVALTRSGYRVAPHLAARLVEGEDHLRRLAERLDAADVRTLFVVGGDAPEPRGPFEDAASLIAALDRVGFRYEHVGIGGYPDGHGDIPEATLDTALRQKAAHADRIITQICFDAATSATWAASLARTGVDVPVFLGVPGPVNRQKLMRISAAIGVGQSARFLQKQQSLVWRLLLPGGYDPTRLVRRLGKALGEVDTHVSGLHVFTFNELERTEAWRRKLLGSLRDRDRTG